nr:hypothetical protein [Candidatus Sigynarchaeota archaeon]
AIEERKKKEAEAAAAKLALEPAPVPQIPSQPQASSVANAVPTIAKAQTESVQFEDGGISYKIENGVVFKKEWTRIAPERTDARVMKRDPKRNTTKIITDENVWIEELTWKKIG